MPDWTFETSPVAYEYLNDRAFSAFAIGPVGCLSGDAMVVTEEGQIPISRIDRPMLVLSWDDQTSQFRLAPSGGAFPKGRDCLFRVSTPLGEWRAAANHRVLCADGEYRQVQNLRVGDFVRVCGDDRTLKFALRAPPVSRLDDPRSWQTVASFRASCARSAHQYDPQPRQETETARQPVPLSSDALLSGQSCERSGGSVELERLHIHPDPQPALHAMTDFAPRPVDLLLCEEYQHTAAISSLPLNTAHQTSALSAPSTNHHPLTRGPVSHSVSLPSSTCYQPILEIERGEVKETFWDMQVWATNNYVTTDGLIHHNSGKSVPSLMRILHIGMEQEPSPDGIKRSRFAVIRNTMPELRATTTVTYQQIYPAETAGDIIWRSPATHYIKPRGANLEIEVNFIALDKPRDVKKLLSLELTGAFVNEVREVPRSVVTRLTERVGRFGLNERPTTWSGIWGDTNPPDADHWLYNWDKVKRPLGFEFYHQPPGVLEVQPIPGGAIIRDENFPDLQDKKISSAEVLVYHRGKTQWVDCPIEVIPSADRHWIVNPWGENMAALSRVNTGTNPLGARSYYGRALAGKNLAEIQSYLQGVYVYVQDGRRVVPQYNDQTQAIKDMPILDDMEICAGMDIGGGTLQPSCIFFQRHPRGNHLIQGEVICYDMGVKRFGELVASYMVRHFPKHVSEGNIGTFYGDPAGVKRDEIFETASFEYLRNQHGFDMQAAPTQDPKMRVAAISGPCERLIDGKPGLMISSERAPTLRKALSGAWYYKRYQVSGEVAFADKPIKNDYSHPGDACGYGLLGLGEFERIGGRRKNSGPLVAMASGDFNVF